jgi:hypothetical protein
VAIPITVRCECGETHSTTLGDSVDCVCGRHYETSTLPPEQFAGVRARQARIKLYLQLGFVFLAAALALGAVFWGLKGVALAIPFAALVWFLFLGKWYRRRWLRDVGETTPLQLEATKE